MTVSKGEINEIKGTNHFYNNAFCNIYRIDNYICQHSCRGNAGMGVLVAEWVKGAGT